METITIPRIEYKRLKNSYKKLKKLEKIDLELVRQFANSLEDLKHGRFKRVA